MNSEEEQHLLAPVDEEEEDSMTPGNTPSQLPHFKTASLLVPGMLECETFQYILESEGNKDHYMNTALAYITSLKDRLVAYENLYLPQSESQVRYGMKFQENYKMLRVRKLLLKDIKHSY